MTEEMRMKITAAQINLADLISQVLIEGGFNDFNDADKEDHWDDAKMDLQYEYYDAISEVIRKLIKK